MNYFDQNQDEEETDFNDRLEEAVPEVNVKSAPVARPPQQAAPAMIEEYYGPDEEDQEAEEVEEDLSAILNDARLRLEQGKLYELVLQNDLFIDTGIDERAVKYVQKEIRKFAQERMEIMLGMRQEQASAQTNAFPAEAFPFNSLEVEVLKSLAAAATKGASREAADFIPETVPAPKKGLSPIAGRRQLTPTSKPISKPLAQKPKTQLQRQRPAAQQARRTNSLNAEQQRILEESGVTLEEINATFPPDYKPLDADFTGMTKEEFDERNLQGARRTQKQVPAVNAVQMPTIEQTNALYEQRVAQAQPQI
jgi:hypothetical protein